MPICIVLRFVLPSTWWHSKGAKRPMTAPAVRALLSCGGGTVCTNIGTLFETLRATLTQQNDAQKGAAAAAASSLGRGKGATSSEFRVILLFESDLVPKFILLLCIGDCSLFKHLLIYGLHIILIALLLRCQHKNGPLGSNATSN